MASKRSMKASEKGFKFLKNLRTNRRKVDVDDEDLSFWKLLELITDFFKSNNAEYLKLVNMEYRKNV